MDDPEPDAPTGDPEPRPRPLLGPAFWALMIFSVLCVLAGVGVALLGPKLIPTKADALQIDATQVQARVPGQEPP